MAETSNKETIEFEWGKKRGIGGRKKDVQFYESFTYDGVKYSLFDSVYLYKEGEPEPYIGKLIKIWENPDKSKKVKVLWFFRPCEILNFLGTNETCDNELFLASGEGIGLANVNPLEAIAGKCNVICISKDSRNMLPSDEELQMAEFVFYRFFDVGHCRILDKIDDMIAGIEVKFIFNKLDSQKPAGVVKPGLDKKEVNALASNEVMAPSGQKNKEHVVEKEDDHFVDMLVSENADLERSLVKQNSSMGAKPTFGVGVEETTESNDGLQNLLGGKTKPQAKVKGNGVSKASLVKQKSSSGQPHASTTSVELRETTKRHDGEGNISSDQAKMSEVDSKGDKRDVGGDHVRQVKVERDVKSTKNNNGVVESKLSKKPKLGDSSKISNENNNTGGKNRRLICDNNEDDDDENMNTLAPRVISLKGKRGKDSCDVEEGPTKKLKFDKKPILAGGKLHKESPTSSPSAERKLDCSVMEVTRRHDVDRSRWFRIPWEERLKTAHDQGTLVLLQNLSPSLTSQEVECAICQDIVCHGFKENCTAKMIQATAFSSPHSGQAFVIFKTKAAAEMVIRKLDQGCLLLSNGRPLVASIGHPCFPEKRPVFYGHLSVEPLRSQMQREMKDAVSTSHCSQPNNIEYDMAMEWCLLQERADHSWKRLYQRHGEELRKLKAKLKSK